MTTYETIYSTSCTLYDVCLLDCSMRSDVVCGTSIRFVLLTAKEYMARIICDVCFGQREPRLKQQLP